MATGVDALVQPEGALDYPGDYVGAADLDDVGAAGADVFLLCRG